MKTTVHAYCFDTRVPAEAAAWNDLEAKLKATHPHCMHASGSYHCPSLDGVEVELETKHLFENQWNTVGMPTKFNGNGALTTTEVKGKNSNRDAKGLRLFDWALEAHTRSDDYVRHYRRGHYLDQTEEMKAIRRDTNCCGYCGYQEPAKDGHVFCPMCIGSEYLRPDQLHLLRMIPVDKTGFNNFVPARAPLTEDEAAQLMPLYRHAQIHGNTERDKARILKERVGIANDFARATHVATVERDGKTWLMDHGVKLGLVIFYNHTERWSFGWSGKIDDATVPDLQKALEGFPFPYDIQCQSGKVIKVEAKT